MNKGLNSVLASCFAAGSLFFTGCGSKNEYHSMKFQDDTFFAKSAPVGEEQYKSAIWAKGKAGRIYFEILGPSLSSSEEFSITSIEISPSNLKSEKVYAADKELKTHLLPAFHYEHMLRKDHGRDSFNSGLMGTNYPVFLKHIKECKGESPCYVPKEAR